MSTLNPSMKKMFAMMAVVGAGSDTGNAWMMKPRPKGFLEWLTIPEATKQIMHAAQPTFLNMTVNRIREEIKINNKEDLEGLVKTIFEMAENDSVDTDQETNNPHARMGETYADILFSLSPDMPTFEMEGEKTITFTRILLNAIQDSFESLMDQFAEAEKAGTATDPTTVNRLISVVSFIGHLHVRKLMPTSLMPQVVDDLIGLTRYNNIFVVRDRHPDPTLIRCVCELMQIIGKVVDANEQGKILITEFLDRLSQLADSRERDTKEFRVCVGAVQSARLDSWPARAGTQVVVQYEVVTYAEACRIWHKLKELGQLPPDQMTLPEPQAEVEGLRISSVLSNRDVAILFDHKPQKTEEVPFKSKITKATGIHPERLVVLFEGEPYFG